jgi:transmembrane sensor
MKDNGLINDIIVKAITDSALTSAESAILDEWLTDEENSQLFEQLKNKDYLLQRLIEAHTIDVEGDKVLLQQKLGIGKRIPIKRQWKSFWDVATSAAAVLILAAAIFYWFNNTRKPGNNIVSNEKPVPDTITDAQPGKTTALLTLADGSKVLLDSTATGQLAQQGGMVVVKENNGLKYVGDIQPQREELYNTLSTANGQTYGVVLADGSKVWLNAAASIRYPVAFKGSERKVEVTGEVYFEVAHDKSKRFIVEVLPPTSRGAGGGRNVKVEVLGTHFNINAYNDEAVIKTTLMEGSVKIKQGATETLLKPGQQAQVGSGITKVLNNVDLDAAVAWKNGRFNFDSVDIAVAMSQLTKWYNVEGVYEGARPTKLLIGEIDRNLMLSEVIKMLEYTGIHFRIDGRKLVVMSPEKYEAWKSKLKQQK